MQRYQHFDYDWKTTMQRRCVTCFRDVASHIIAVSITRSSHESRWFCGT